MILKTISEVSLKIIIHRRQNAIILFLNRILTVKAILWKEILHFEKSDQKSRKESLNLTLSSWQKSENGLLQGGRKIMATTLTNLPILDHFPGHNNGIKFTYVHLSPPLWNCQWEPSWGTGIHPISRDEKTSKCIRK